MKDELVRRISLVDFMYAISLLLKGNDATLMKCKDIQKKKLYKLGFFERDKETNDPNQVIHIFSSYELSHDEKTLLAKGLNFSIPSKNLNLADHVTPFVYKDVKACDISDHFNVFLCLILFS